MKKIEMVILCDTVIFLIFIFENFILSRESYAFPRFTAENHMSYDITAAICKMKEKSFFL